MFSKNKLGDQRIYFTDKQRIALAEKAKKLGRQILNEIDTLLVMDCDTKFTKEFKSILVREGVKPILCPVRAPNCNAFAERFVLSIKEECLNRLILFSEESLHRSINEFVQHYHTERNDQGVRNRLLRPLVGSRIANDPVYRRDRLGGMLNYYHREAA